MYNQCCYRSHYDPKKGKIWYNVILVFNNFSIIIIQNLSKSLEQHLKGPAPHWTKNFLTLVEIFQKLLWYYFCTYPLHCYPSFLIDLVVKLESSSSGSQTLKQVLQWWIEILINITNELMSEKSITNIQCTLLTNSFLVHHFIRYNPLLL